MTTAIETKREEARKIQVKINRLTSVPAYKVRQMNSESRKMMLNTINEFDTQRMAIIAEIIKLQSI
jgi:uncharacterized protein YbgA (DUF1722 family)